MIGLRKSTLPFAHSEPLTLGVEIEVQLLDSETLDLKGASPSILAKLGGGEEKVKAEIFQSMLELNTSICRDAKEAKRDLSTTMDRVEEVCRTLGLRMASSGTHPFALYNERVLYPAQRYRDLIDRNQWIARRLMIFGLHVHVGMRSGPHAIEMNKALIHYLPLLLALSASSPYWHGEETELASSRITFFEALPTGGHPCVVDSWEEFEKLYARLERSKSVRSPKDIWWDIRPSPSFGTLEIRICDGLPTLEETAALTALIHALCIKLDEEIASGRRFKAPADWVIRENKWRASRFGVEALMIIDDDGDTRPMRDVLADLFSALAPIVAKQSYEDEFALLRKLIAQGISYERQRAVIAHAGGDLKALVDFLASEFEARHPIWMTTQVSNTGT